MRIPDWVTHLGNDEFPPLNLFFSVQGDGFWTEVTSYLSFITALFSDQPHHYKSKGGEDSRKQLSPEAAGLGTRCRTEQLAVKFPSFKSLTGSQKLLLVAALGSQTALDRWSSVAQQSFALWETELGVGTKTVTICSFISDVVPSNRKRTEIENTEIFITSHRTHLHGSTSAPVWNTVH